MIACNMRLNTCFCSADGIDPYELEDFLTEIMSAEFNSFIEDNSSAEVRQSN